MASNHWRYCNKVACAVVGECEDLFEVLETHRRAGGCDKKWATREMPNSFVVPQSQKASLKESNVVATDRFWGV